MCQTACQFAVCAMDRDREAAAAAAFARLHRADKELGETISKLQEFPRRLTVPHKVWLLCLCNLKVLNDSR